MTGTDHDEILEGDEAARASGLTRSYLLRAINGGFLKGAVVKGPIGIRVTRRALLDWIDDGAKVGDDDK